MRFRATFATSASFLSVVLIGAEGPGMLARSAPLAAGRAGAVVQSAIDANPSPSRLSPSRKYPLRDGSLVHAQYMGRLDRMDASGNLTATARVPRSVEMRISTEVLLPPDQRRVLLIYTDDDSEATARHQLILLDAQTLKTEVTLRMGPCTDGGNSQIDGIGSLVALFCQAVPHPSARSKNKELALVSLDTSTGRVVTQFVIGGSRYGRWFGPMFFGYYHDAYATAVPSSDAPCPSLEPGVRVPDSTASRNSAIHLERVFVVSRRGKQNAQDTWEAWFDSGPNQAPRRSAPVLEHPLVKTLCWGDAGDPATPARLLLYVEVDPGTHPVQETRVFRSAQNRRVVVIDVATGEVLTPS